MDMPYGHLGAARISSGFDPTRLTGWNGWPGYRAQPRGLIREAIDLLSGREPSAGRFGLWGNPSQDGLATSAKCAANGEGARRHQYLIDFSRPEARNKLARYDAPAISLVSWMEVMAGASLVKRPQDFLDGFQHFPIDDQVAGQAVAFDARDRSTGRHHLGGAQSQRCCSSPETARISADEP